MSRRTVFFILFLLVLAAAGGALAVVLPRIIPRDESWTRAEQAMAGGEFERARSYLVDYVVRFPRDARGQWQLARCYRQAVEMDPEMAGQHLRKAEQLGGIPADVALEADLLEFQWHGGPPELEERLESLAEQNPAQAPLVLEALARGCLYQQRFNSANKYLDRWVQAAPEDPRARQWRAALFEHMARPQLAIEDYRVALRQRSDDARLRKRLGLVLATSGYDFAESRGLLTEYLAEEPEDVDALCGLARCQRAAGELDEALATAERVLAREPDSIEALRTKALAQLDQQQDEAALETLGQLREAVQRADPELPMRRLGRLNPLLENPHQTQYIEEQLHLEAQALQRLGREAEARERLERLAQVQNDVRRLKRLLEQRAERSEDAEYLYEVINLLLAIGQPRQADSWVRRLQSLAPNDPRIQELLQAVRETSSGRRDSAEGT